LKKYQSNSNSYSFFNLLTSDALFNKVEELLPEHRKRLYPPTETLSMFLAQTMNDARSCQNLVNQAALQRLHGGLNTGILPGTPAPAFGNGQPINTVSGHTDGFTGPG
jgi:hypothetical protein